MTIRRGLAIGLAAAFIASGCSQSQTRTGSNASGSANASSLTQGLDIDPAAGIVLGPGWYAIEHYGGETFRWAQNDAQITACPDSSDRTLAMMLEPGPGIGAKSMHVTISGNRGDDSAATLSGRQFAKVNIARGARGETFAIHADTKNLRSPHGDPRILNYRLLEATLGFSTASCPNDVTRDGTLAIGAGWYPYETFNGNTFRWVNNNAQVIVPQAQPKPFTIQVDAAPGPSLGGPLVLTLTGLGAASTSRPPIKTRQLVDLNVPAQPAGAKLTLSAHSKNVPAPRDKRTLNFQVFGLWIKP